MNNINSEIKDKLVRIKRNTYIWKDDRTIALNIEDLTFADLAPNFRVLNNYVEIPRNWKSTMRYDKDIIPVIDNLIAQHGNQNLIFAERGGSRIKMGKLDIEQPLHMGNKKIGTFTEPYTVYSQTKYTNGWLIPVKEWDYALSKVIGVKWLMSNEEMSNLLNKHKSFNTKGGY